MRYFPSRPLLHCHDEARRGLRRRDRWKLRLAYWLGLPVAGVVSVVQAAFRRGGAIVLTAARTRSESWSMPAPPARHQSSLENRPVADGHIEHVAVRAED